MTGIHGGDIYRNQVDMDFSINVNPLGMPEAVQKALYRAAKMCGRYPDPKAEKLKKAVSAMQSLPEDCLLFGNGASELLMAVVHGLKPGKIVIPVPSFYGYAYAAEAADGEIFYYEAKEENGFRVAEDFYGVLDEDVDLLFLANPNNPTGDLLDRKTVGKILGHCRERGICVVLDECFIEFCGGRSSMLPEIGQLDNLILLRAFTKIFSIPGVRLGYLACSNPAILQKIGRHLPEWNLSCFAQEAGCVCAGQIDFIAKTEDYVRRERQFLEMGLRGLGFPVYASQANFLLIRSRQPLYEQFLEKQILIRDCGNFRGLGPGFYRIAVKTRRENEIFLRELKERVQGENDEENRTIAAGRD